MNKTKNLIHRGLLNKGFIFFLFLAVSIPVKGQEESEKKFHLAESKKNQTLSIDSDNYDNYDVNGSLAAGVIIQIDHPSPSFSSSNGIIKQTKTDNGYEILLSSNEREFTVYAEGYLPFNINFGAEDIELEAGSFWEIKLSSDKSESSLDILTQFTLISLEKSLEVLPTSDMSNYDVNGSLGVGLKIITDSNTKEVAFTSENGIVKTEARDGHYLVVVSVVERNLTIQPKGSLPFTIIFKDKQIKLESGDIWNLELKKK